MDIREDDVSGPQIIALLEEHLADMRATSPPESIHALDLDDLRRADVTLWTVWDDANLAGCGALKELEPRHGEIKFMRTVKSYRRRGVAALLLRHIQRMARQREYHHLSLETGSQSYFVPARRLYEVYGFKLCPPFGKYVEDPNSVFMTMKLSD